MSTKYSFGNLTELSPIFTDSSVEEYKKELLEYLKEFYDNYSLHSMNEGAIAKQGEKNMLGEIIKLIEIT